MPDFYAQKAHDLRQAGANDTQNLERMLDSSGKLASVELAAIKGKPDPYADLAQQMQSAYGTGMSHGWQGVLQSALLGASSSRKRAELEGLQQKMQQMQDYANHAANANDVAMKNKAAGEAVKPILDAYLTNSDKMAPEQRLESLKSALNTYNNIAKTDYELFSVDAQNPAKVTLSSKTKGFQGLDMLNSPIFAEINRQKQIQDIENKAEQYSKDRMALEQAKVGIDRDRVAAYNKDIANRWSPAEQFNKSSAIKQGELGAVKVDKLKEQNMGLTDQEEIIKEMKGLLSTGKVITGQSPTAGMQKIIGKRAGTEAWSDTELYDALAKGLYSMAKDQQAKFGNVNRSEFEFLIQPVPDSQKTRSANIRLLDRYENKIKRMKLANEWVVGEHEDFNPKAGSPASTAPNPIQAETNTTLQGAIQMKTPKGTVISVAADNVQNALNKGLVKVE